MNCETLQFNIYFILFSYLSAFRVNNKPGVTTKEIVDEFVTTTKRPDDRALDITNPAKFLAG